MRWWIATGALGLGVLAGCAVDAEANPARCPERGACAAGFACYRGYCIAAEAPVIELADAALAARAAETQSVTDAGARASSDASAAPPDDPPPDAAPSDAQAAAPPAMTPPEPPPAEQEPPEMPPLPDPGELLCTTLCGALPICEACCKPRESFCDGHCVDTNRDRKHCGACGNVCDGRCRDGRCSEDEDD